MGESTAKVSEEYSQAGLAIPEQHKNEPPDYIGFELDFMRYLCSQEVSAWKRKRFSDAKSLLERQKKFLSKHIIRWVPDFCDRVLEEAKTGFYRGIAKITKGFVKFEFDQLDYLIDMAKKIEP
jgi:TorA maturation chaperone TorD